MNDFSIDAKAVIADLGSACKLASPNETIRFKIGTPGYIAPEILSGEQYSYPCDIWSLGCLLHVLLTATPPFWDDDSKERNRKVCYDSLNLADNQYACQLSDQCKEFLQFLLTKDQYQRPSITQVLNHAWIWAN